MADVSEQMEIHTMETLGPRRVVVASFGNHDFDFGVCARNEQGRNGP